MNIDNLCNNNLNYDKLCNNDSSYDKLSNNELSNENVNNNLYELEKLINFIKIFNGIIYGEYISNYYINKVLCNNKEYEFSKINILFILQRLS